LQSIGVSLAEAQKCFEKEPKELFHWLVEKHDIVFLNVSYHFVGEYKPEVCDVSDAERPAEKLLTVLRTQFALPEGEVQISGSIGMALYPDNGDDTERLIASADTALYRAKRAGKSRYEIALPLQ
jgi:GGDEF domain-containing protein